MGMIIAIDFDGTIAHNAWPSIGEPVEGAIETIGNLYAEGHMLVLWTCRSGGPLDWACRWLDYHGVLDCFAAFNRNLSSALEQYGTDPRKIGADLYIDDAALGAQLNDDGTLVWSYVLEMVADRAEAMMEASDA